MCPLDSPFSDFCHQVFPLEYRKTALSPDLSQTHHSEIFWGSDTLVTTVECWVATAGQNPPADTGSVEARFSSRTILTVPAVCLIATKIFPGGFVAVQSMITQRFPLGTEETILFRAITETIFLRTVGKVDAWNIPFNLQEFQSSVHRPGVVPPIQRQPAHAQPGAIVLFFQMSKDNQAFLFVGRVYVHTGNDAMLAIHGCLRQIPNAAFDSMMDISCLWIGHAGGSGLGHLALQRSYR